MIILILCLTIFWYLLVLYVNCSVKRLKFAPKWSNAYFQPILAAIFVTIATDIFCAQLSWAWKES